MRWLHSGRTVRQAFIGLTVASCLATPTPSQAADDVVPAEVIVEALLPLITLDLRGFGTDRSPTEETKPTLGQEIRNGPGELTTEQTVRLTQSIQEGTLPAFDLAVGFAADSAAITDAMAPALDQLGLALSDDLLSQDLFVLSGSASTGDSASMGQALAISRSKAVRDYVIRKFDVDPSRLVAVGDLSGGTHAGETTLRIVNLAAP